MQNDTIKIGICDDSKIKIRPVYISHRLSSCKFCDEIAVFHEGSVIQKGTHEALVADKSGKYYELWNAQAQYYADDAGAIA